MKIAYITAGAAGMYCGTCMHDNTLATSLIEMGHEVSLLPVYTPTRTDEASVADEHIFFDALNVYLQQKSPFFRRRHPLLDRLLDHPRVLGWVSKLGAASNDATMLGSMTLSMLEGERGPQAKELDKLADFLESIIEPDIVHLSFTLFAGFARRLRQRLGVPIVCSLQGEDLFFDQLEEPWRARVLAEMTSRLDDIAAFTAPSRYYAELMSTAYDVPAERIHLARLGISTDDFAGLSIASKRDAASESSAPVIGYLARICPEKGLHLLIDAFEQVIERRPDSGARLRIAGYLGPRDRDYFDQQVARVEAAGLRSRVDFVGEVDRQGKLDFLAGLDLLSVPTVYREPKGLFVPEALAAGVPVVQPAHGSFPEWIEHTGGGLLVEPQSATALANGLIELIDDPERRHQLGDQGRQAVMAQFGHQAMASEMLAIYRLVVGTGATTAPSAIAQVG